MADGWLPPDTAWKSAAESCTGVPKVAYRTVEPLVAPARTLTSTVPWNCRPSMAQPVKGITDTPEKP